jgi:hypothetical protein
MAKKQTKKATAPKLDLPPDVKEADTKWPSYKENSKPWRVGENANLPYSLTFYKIKGRTSADWVICTLHISNPSRRQQGAVPARTYSIGIEDSKVYTVGRGPHVIAEVTVYLTADNIDRLRKYCDLYTQGMADASIIRDRISTRRAQGTLRRSGLPGWM